MRYLPLSFSDRNFVCIVRFQVLMAASMNVIIFWDVAPYSLVEIYRRFRCTYCLWNVGQFLSDYTAQKSRRQSSLCAFLISPVHATYTAHVILLYLIILKLFNSICTCVWNAYNFVCTLSIRNGGSCYIKLYLENVFWQGENGYCISCSSLRHRIPHRAVTTLTATLLFLLSPFHTRPQGSCQQGVPSWWSNWM
jgi:hypothetical protein